MSYKLSTLDIRLSEKWRRGLLALGLLVMTSAAACQDSSGGNGCPCAEASACAAVDLGRAPPDLELPDVPCKELIAQGKSIIKCWDFRKTDLSDFTATNWQLDPVAKTALCKTKMGCELDAKASVDLMGKTAFDVMISHRLTIPWELSAGGTAAVYIANTALLSRSNSGTPVTAPYFYIDSAHLGPVSLSSVPLRLQIDSSMPISESVWEVQYLAFVQ